MASSQPASPAPSPSPRAPFPPARRAVPADLPELTVRAADLVAVQRESFERFAQASLAADARRDEGLQGAMRAAFPVKSEDQVASLEFVGYALEAPRYDADESRRRGLTWAAPIKVTIRLIVWDLLPDGSGVASIRDIKEQEVYFGEVPLLTPRGTFVVDGVERVVAPRRVPRAGPHLSRRASDGAAVATVVGTRGVTLELALDADGAVTATTTLAPWSRADGVLRGGGAPRTLLLSASNEALWPLDEAASRAAAASARRDITAPGTGALLVRKGAKLGAAALARMRAAGCAGVPLSDRDVGLLRLAADIPVPDADAAPRARRHARLSSALVAKLVAHKVATVQVYAADELPAPPADARFADARELAQWFDARFGWFDIDTAGRAAMHALVGPEQGDAQDFLLSPFDLVALVERLRAVQRGERAAEPWRPEALWCAGEALTARAFVGLVATAARVRDLLQRAGPEVDTLMPHDLINAKPFAQALRALVTDPDLCPVLDARNPLAAVAHTRRVVAPSVCALPLGARPDGDDRVAAEPAAAPSLAEALAPLRALDAAAPHGGHTGAGDARPEYEAMPLASAEAPWVGTGLERAACEAAGAVQTAAHAGEVTRVDAHTVLLWPEDLAAPVQVATARPFRHAPQGASQSERVLVAHGARVSAGDALIDAAGAAGGELALGRNAVVAFASDAPAGAARVSARLAEALGARTFRTLDRLVRDTPEGPEYVTAALPGGPLPALDASGVVPLGATVAPGDVLVGVCVGDGTAGGARDVSLRAPADLRGVVRHLEWFCRPGQERSPRATALLEAQAAWRKDVVDAAGAARAASLRRRAAALLEGATLRARLVDDQGRVLVPRDARLTREVLDGVPARYLRELEPTDERAADALRALALDHDAAFERVATEFGAYEYDRWRDWRRDVLPAGVREHLRLTVETPAPLALGDRLADRRGLVVAVREIVPDDAMPRLADGTPVDVVLPADHATPGVLAELAVGRAARALGTPLRVPADGALAPEALAALCREAGVPAGAWSELRDPRTGAVRASAVPAGVLYLLRLPAAG